MVVELAEHEAGRSFGLFELLALHRPRDVEHYCDILRRDRVVTHQPGRGEEHEGIGRRLHLEGVSLNSGAIPTGTTDGSFTVHQVYDVSGTVSFWQGGAGVPGVELALEGDRVYSGLSGDLKDLFGPVLPLNDLQGVELYYNAAITPWFHLTADVQFVQPGISANDTAIVLGLRGKIDL